MNFFLPLMLVAAVLIGMPTSVPAQHSTNQTAASESELIFAAPRLQSLPQIFHQRVLSMTFRKTFNGGNDSVSELAIELWRLKAKRVERRIGTPAFPSLGLYH